MCDFGRESRAVPSTVPTRLMEPYPLLTLETVTDGTSTDETETLTQNPTIGHVLLRLELTEVEGAGKYEDVGHVDETLEERNCNLNRHPLRRLNHIQVTLEIHIGN